MEEKISNHVLVQEFREALKSIVKITGGAREHECAGWDCETCAPSVINERAARCYAYLDALVQLI